MDDMPVQVDLDGYVDELGIVYVGIATRQPNGEYHALAKVEGCLCRVACRIELKKEAES